MPIQPKRQSEYQRNYKVWGFILSSVFMKKDSEKKIDVIPFPSFYALILCASVELCLLII